MKGYFKMNVNKENTLVCPNCNSSDFQIKCQATYVYTYEIKYVDDNSITTENGTLPYLFNNREKINEKDYVLCKKCGSTYPCSLNKGKDEINLTILQRALRSDYQETPELWG